MHGAKGGVGASLLACQVAVRAASRGSAALIDLDVTGGSTSALLGLEERGSLLSLIGMGDGGDGATSQRQYSNGATSQRQYPNGATLQQSSNGATSQRRFAHEVEVGAVARMHRSGLALLAAEPFDRDADRLDGRAVRELLAFLRSRFGVLVVDVPAGVDDRGVSALAVADVVLLVVTPEVPCVVSARRLVDALSLHRFPLERVGVLVNMLDVEGGVAPERIARALSLRLAGAVPFDREVVRAAVDGGWEHGGVLAPGIVHDAVAAAAEAVLPAEGRAAGGEWLAVGAGAAR